MRNSAMFGAGLIFRKNTFRPEVAYYWDIPSHEKISIQGYLGISEDAKKSKIF